MHNPPPSQKPELPIWVWALIGSGGTLILFLVGYGIWSLTTSKSPDSSVASVSQKSEDANPLFPVTKNGKHGFIDRNGNTVIPPQFDNIGSFPAKNNGLDMSIFPEELMAVSVGEKWGYIDKTGKIVIQPQFDGAINFSDGMAFVQTQNAQGSNPLQGFIDKSGKLVIQLNNTQKQDFFTYFQEGFAPIYRWEFN